MDIANQMVLFAKVVDHGGFSAAGRELGLTPSAVSRQIGNLEDRLGTRLLNRSTHNFTLTDVGHEFYARCATISENVTDAEALVLSLVDHPQGNLKIAATSAFAKSQMMHLLPAFLENNPDVTLSMELTDRSIDLIEDHIDVAIRFSEQLNDVSVISKKLAPNKRVLCASPEYIDKYGAPQKLTDLQTHNCLKLSTVEAFNDWTMTGHGSTEIIHASGNFDTTSSDAVYHAALAGIGIAKLSTYLVSDAFRSGTLVRVLPDYIEDASEIVAVYPNRRNLSPNVRAFIDYLTEQFGPTPPWER